eukprot:4710657-Lingulodinium_polyedra.AAC.1
MTSSWQPALTTQSSRSPQAHGCARQASCSWPWTWDFSPAVELGPSRLLLWTCHRPPPSAG